MLIQLTGLDKMGKSTIAKALALKLADSLLTKEPGSPLVSGNIELRKIVLEDISLTPLERELIFYADASKHRRFIETNKDKMIISDRGKWCHEAYLYGYLKTGQVDFDLYKKLYTILTEVAAVPDITFYVKGSLELMKERQANDGAAKDAIEANGDEFYQAVSARYDDLYEKADKANTFKLDATKPIDKNVVTMVSLINSWRAAKNDEGTDK